MDLKIASSSASSATTIANSDDVLTEILVRLPIKTLIIFKLVSKHWYFLISTAHFSQLHTLRHHRSPPSYFLLRATPSRFFYFDPRGRKFLPYDLPFTSPKLLQSCNGLLLLQCCNSEAAVEDCVIYNPITRGSRKILLNNDEKSKNITVLGLSLAFDPSISPYYKVVCLRTTKYSVYSFQIEVYDSKTCTWNCQVEPFSVPHDLKFCEGVYWNSGIHWLRPTGQSLHFDLTKSTFERRTLALRRYLARLGQNFIRESNGHFHAMFLLPEFLVVSEMEEDKSRWLVTYQVDLHTILAEFSEIHGRRVSVLGIIRGKSEEESTLVFHVPGKIMAYRFHNMSFEELVNLRTEAFYREGSLQFGCYDAYQFIETLAPV